MSHYHHLNPYEREIILKNLVLGQSIRTIAAQLERSPATISRELRRNQFKGEYSPTRAELAYHKRRTRCHRQRLLSCPPLHDLVQQLILNHQWSPEQIAARLKMDHSRWKISYTTIYRGIEHHLLDEGTCQRGQRGLARQLRHRGKTRHRQGYIERRGKIQISHSIGERPPEANERRMIGHWEADTVLGKSGSECLVTLVDRKTRFLMAAKAVKKSAKYVKAKLVELLKRLPEEQRLTITPDRGKEFAQHAEVTKELAIPFYFPDPHAPWQRGSNENTNGLLREYFPKGQDFKLFTDSDVLHAVEELNRRPRKCLGWKTPFEAFYDQVLHLV